MKDAKTNYHKHPVPDEIILYAAQLYHRCSLSTQNIKNLIDERVFLQSLAVVGLAIYESFPSHVTDA